MTLPVLLESIDGQFAAMLLGAPNVRVVGATGDQAIASLKAEIQQRVEQVEILLVEIDAAELSSLAGKYRDDPTLREICEDAYALRDAEPRERTPSTRTS
jgi:hypothetical protein